jgi:hypothetical protein
MQVSTICSHQPPGTEDDVTERVSSDDRPELHNPSIDQDVAMRGACGRVHLPTGNTCTLAHNHLGSCNFISRDDVEDRLPGPHVD